MREGILKHFHRRTENSSFALNPNYWLANWFHFIVINGIHFTVEVYHFPWKWDIISLVPSLPNIHQVPAWLMRNATVNLKFCRIHHSVNGLTEIFLLQHCQRSVIRLNILNIWHDHKAHRWIITLNGMRCVDSSKLWIWFLAHVNDGGSVEYQNHIRHQSMCRLWGTSNHESFNQWRQEWFSTDF